MKLHSETYEEYKDSDGEWADSIPSEWQEVRVKDLFRLVTQAAPEGNNYELLSLYSSIGVRPRKDMEARGNKASSTDGYWIVKKDDIVVNKLLAWMGGVGISEYDGVTSPAYDVLRKLKANIDPRYFSYLFRTEIAKKIFRKNSRGIMDMRLRLYFDKLGAITIPCPPSNVQNIIANYIGIKVSQIDKKITLLSSKGKLYKSLRQSIIDDLVLHGMNSNVPLRDSEVTWLGEIPEHWDLKRVKEIGSINKRTLSKNTPSDYEFDYVDIGSVTFGSETYEKEKLKFENAPSRAKRVVVKGDTIISTVRTYLKAIMSFTEEVSDIVVSTGFAVVSPSRVVVSKYCSYFLTSSHIVDEICALSKGVSYPATTSTVIGDLFFPIPPYSEQNQIVNYLDVKTKEIDTVVSKVNQQIEKLKELRIAIINDAVTGKIKVSENNKDIG
jgi:type I restriction enzyme S subunit